jgi:hypothetical protein
MKTSWTGILVLSLWTVLVGLAIYWKGDPGLALVLLSLVDLALAALGVRHVFRLRRVVRKGKT